MIVSGGEALVDLVPQPVPGGGPMNVAVGASRLGAPTAFLGCVSTDEYGEAIWDHLVDNGVRITLCPRSTAPTARAIVEYQPELVFRFEGHNTADTLLASADLSTLGAGPYIVHGGTLGFFRGQTAETLAELVESHNGVVSFDPNVRPQIIDDGDHWLHFHDRWLARASIYKGSDEDLEWIWPSRSPESCAEEILAAGVHVVVVTRGGSGLSILTAGDEVKVAAPTVQVVDTVGAGDTIVGAVLVSLVEAGVDESPGRLLELTSLEWRTIGERAVVAVGITCSRPGADPPWRSEVGW